MHSRHLIVLAATAALLAGCGGGTEPEPTATAATKVMAATSAATATPADGRRTAQAVTPEQTAEQLLDFAEQRYTNYFPSHQATQSLAPFRFRHYPETGVYVGVVVTAGMGYTFNGIYVMGGPFGSNPVYVGQVDHFITPAGPGTGGAAGNGCYDLALMDTPGTHIEVLMVHGGAVTGTQTLDWVVNGSTMFETHSAIETIVRTTGTLVDDISTPVDIESRSYARRTADAEVTRYGGETISKTTIGDDALTTTIRTVYTPAAIDRQAGLELGQSMTQTSTARSTSTTTGLPGVPATPVTTTDTSTETITFAARERLTVQGRSYDTCKFTTTFAGEPGVTHTMWVIDGKGIPVKITVTDGDSVTTQEATSVKLNGTRL